MRMILLLLPPSVPVFLDRGGVVALLHEGAIPLELDGLCERYFAFILLLCHHVRGLFLGLHQFVGVSAHQHSVHLVLLEHINQ